MLHGDVGYENWLAWLLAFSHLDCHLFFLSLQECCLVTTVPLQWLDLFSLLSFPLDTGLLMLSYSVDSVSWEVSDEEHQRKFLRTLVVNAVLSMCKLWVKSSGIYSGSKLSACWMENKSRLSCSFLVLPVTFQRSVSHLKEPPESMCQQGSQAVEHCHSSRGVFKVASCFYCWLTVPRIYLQRFPQLPYYCCYCPGLGLFLLVV